MFWFWTVSQTRGVEKREKLNMFMKASRLKSLDESSITFHLSKKAAKSEDLLVFSVSYHCELNIFWFWGLLVRQTERVCSHGRLKKKKKRQLKATLFLQHNNKTAA